MHDSAVLGTAFNGTLTISTQQETDPGYDMGANHTYRYVKTSGLGTLPKYWFGDKIQGYQYGIIQDRYLKDFYIARVSIKGFNNNNNVRNYYCLIANNGDKGSYSASYQPQYKFLSTVFDTTSDITEYCSSPSLEDISIGHTISGNEIVYGFYNTGKTLATNASRNPYGFNLGVSYWTNWTTGGSGGSDMWYVSAGGSIQWTNGGNANIYYAASCRIYF